MKIINTKHIHFQTRTKDISSERELGVARHWHMACAYFWPLHVFVSNAHSNRSTLHFHYRAHIPFTRSFVRSFARSSTRQRSPPPKQQIQCVAKVKLIGVFPLQTTRCYANVIESQIVSGNLSHLLHFIPFG